LIEIEILKIIIRRSSEIIYKTQFVFIAACVRDVSQSVS